MKQHIKDFKEALGSGRDLDFIKCNGYKFDKDELIGIIAELFYSAYEEATDGGCIPAEEGKQNYEGFIRRFINNMNEYECGFFEEEEEADAC